MKILMTGATGAVGGPLIKQFLAMGHLAYVLVRPKGEFSGLSRVNLILGGDPKCGVVEGDITQINCGLSAESLDELIAFKPDVIVHVAANVKMDARREAEIRTANITGTVNMLALARRLKVPNFHYVSTAYVDNGNSNVYEIAKAEAEAAVTNSGLNYTISRISIVVGDSKTGEISGFTGYYGFFTPFIQIAKAIRKKKQLKDTACVEIPVTIKVSKDAILNLIPVDWVAMMLARITAKPACNRVLLVTHPSPPLTVDVIYHTLSALYIRGVMIGEENAAPDDLWKREQETYERVMEIFEPYVGKSAAFDSSSLKEFLGEEYVEPPRFDRFDFNRLITYAVDVNFGRKRIAGEQSE